MLGSSKTPSKVAAFPVTVSPDGNSTLDSWPEVPDELAVRGPDSMMLVLPLAVSVVDSPLKSRVGESASGDTTTVSSVEPSASTIWELVPVT